MELSYILLQHYWWFLVSLLGALLVFLMFVQGGQTLVFSLGKNETEHRLLINSTGRKWEFTFTTLVVFGGAFFASFPLFYSTSFGGAYWLWMCILICFVIQAVSYEYQNKKGNVWGTNTYRIFLWINGLFGPLLVGVAVGTFFTGADFVVQKGNITDVTMPVISTWQSPLHGLEALGNIWNLLLGIAIVFLARVLALLYFINNVDNDDIKKRARKCLIYNTAFFLVAFLTFLVRTLVADGYAVNPTTSEVYLEPHKYLTNFIQMPIVLIVFLIGVLLVLFGVIKSIFSSTFNKGIWFAGAGTVLTVLGLLLNIGYNNTAYYPSSASLQSSLTIYNSSSSMFTLEVMSYVSLLIPIVLAYIFYAWRAIDLRGTSEEDINSSHSY
ncbi:MAG: cytochrome d ubiquinol oxidase subunit II [Tannerellaceae bacterium]